jgi:hypothetical protein
MVWALVRERNYGVNRPFGNVLLGAIGAPLPDSRSGLIMGDLFRIRSLSLRGFCVARCSVKCSPPWRRDFPVWQGFRANPTIQSAIHASIKGKKTGNHRLFPNESGRDFRHVPDSGKGLTTGDFAKMVLFEDSLLGFRFAVWLCRSLCSGLRFWLGSRFPFRFGRWLCIGWRWL